MAQVTFERLKACEDEGEFWDLLYEDGWEAPDDVKEMLARIDALSAKKVQLEHLLNTPETEDFIKGVAIEAGHQRWRWGDDHDMRKTAGEWFWALGYLAQKAMNAAEAGDIKKARHHTISSAALLANWHRSIVREGGK